MPGRDGTGPLGRGPFAGGGADYYGLGNGLGRGEGSGRGYRNRFRVGGGPCWSSEPDPRVLPRSEETELLKSEARRMRSALDAIQRRLEQLETT